MISLIRRVINGGENVIAFESGIVFQDFLKRSPRCEQFENIANTDTLATNTGSPSTFALLYGNPSETLQIHYR